MKRIAIVVAFWAAPLTADPLDLIDYGALFEQHAADVEPVSETRNILRLDDVTLIQDPAEIREYTGIDESGLGAVGCFVSILATIESAHAACDVSLPEEQSAKHEAYLGQAVSFYAENLPQPTPTGLVYLRYYGLMESQIEGARPFCSNLDLVTNLADRLFSIEGEAEVNRMLSQPRLPVAHPCL
ncbi:hypothetical protein MWU60_10725 [Yoonia sp. F2084L]|uniref:hypothetical protein n=1 Tax=Yoonia sp. F2084L TaxID=2926419 RepID=UPI001FF2FBDD|nr:hypothetical protein [Yoonia sp. F2084L]MCK0096043.1 hypothetical protein [Yoonia sp. F2084L]